MTRSENTPIVEALLRVMTASQHKDEVRAANPHDSRCFLASACTCPTRILVASYREHFHPLWARSAPTGSRSLGEWLLASRGTKERTIVVIDDRPAQPGPHQILVSDHVTPYDWAVAVSLWATAPLWAAQAGVGARDALGEVAVLDRDSIPVLRILLVTPEHSLATRSPSRLRFAAVAPCLPWIQGYGALGNEEKRETMLTALPDPGKDRESFSYLRPAVPLGTFGFEDLIADLSDTNRINDLHSLAKDGQDYVVAALRAVASTWRADLVGPDVRHAVANYLAPLLLAEALPEGGGRTLRSSVMKSIDASQPEREALRRLSGLVGLHATPLRSADVPKGGLLRRPLDLPFFPEEPNFLLIDDQFDLGYAGILGALLFGDNVASVLHKDAATLALPKAGRLECLRGAEPLLEELAREPVADWRAPRIVSWRGDDLAGVFLDLRLWTSRKDAVNVQTRVLQVAECIGTTAIGDPRIDCAMAAVRAGRADSIEAMTLLPLLLSHYDSSLPIILFSSTHQRDVVEALGHRSNIITTFSKPLLSGYRTAGEELRLLVLAIEEALLLLPSRYLWNRLVELRTLRRGKWDFPNNVETVRVTLAQIVWRYLIGHRAQDFFSVPWEYLEARLGWSCPTLETYETGNRKGKAGARKEAMRDWLSEGGARPVLDAIEQFRNRKTHGVGWALSRDDESVGVATASILCALLLDILDGGVNRIGKREQKLGDDVTVWLRRQRPDLGTAGNHLTPDDVFGDRTVGWKEYAAVVVAHLLRKDPTISGATGDACRKYLERVMSS